MNPMQSMLPQAFQFGGYAGRGVQNDNGFGRNTNQADRMTVLLADVIDLRVDRSIPLHADEAVFFYSIAVPKQLYEEEVGSRLRKQ